MERQLAEEAMRLYLDVLEVDSQMAGVDGSGIRGAGDSLQSVLILEGIRLLLGGELHQSAVAFLQAADVCGRTADDWLELGLPKYTEPYVRLESRIRHIGDCLWRMTEPEAYIDPFED